MKMNKILAVLTTLCLGFVACPVQAQDSNFECQQPAIQAVGSSVVLTHIQTEKLKPSDGSEKTSLPVNVYLPEGYNTSSRKYPVLYLLHGAGDDHNGWVQFGEVQHIADEAIASGKATPMIIVMPKANTYNRYFNTHDKKEMFEDFFFEDLIPAIEKNFRAYSEKEFRAVAGLSMGGCGSVVYGLRHPDKFSSVCPLSARIRGYDKADDARVGLSLYKTLDSEESAWDYMKQYGAVSLVREASEEQLKAWRGVRWFFDCGDDDSLYEGNSILHLEMRKQRIPHEFRVRDGGHTWQYWRESLPTVLEFVSKSFHR